MSIQIPVLALNRGYNNVTTGRIHENFGQCHFIGFARYWNFNDLVGMREFDENEEVICESHY